MKFHDDGRIAGDISKGERNEEIKMAMAMLHSKDCPRGRDADEDCRCDYSEVAAREAEQWFEARRRESGNYGLDAIRICGERMDILQRV